MELSELNLSGLYELILPRYEDERGFMGRLYDKSIFEGEGLNTKWAQESLSYTTKKGTVRGLNVSLPPHLEGKTITALTGKALWVSVDLRKNSSTFGCWESLVISYEKNNTLYANKGFAHGCVSLTDNCTLFLRADTNYLHGTGIKFDDPDLKIDWKLNDTPIISSKDKMYPSFADFVKKYGGLVVNE